MAKLILVWFTLIIHMFRLTKFPSAALASLNDATASLRSEALQSENLSCVKHSGN